MIWLKTIYNQLLAGMLSQQLDIKVTALLYQASTGAMSISSGF